MYQLPVKGCVEGPFKSERDFSRAFQKKCRETSDILHVFSLEDSEMNKGAPDIFTINRQQYVTFYELKYVGADGMIRFQQYQPLWYKQHSRLDIEIMVWDSRSDTLSMVLPRTVTAEKSLVIPCTSEYDESRIFYW